MEVLTLTIRETSTCLTLPSRPPDLTTFTRLDELGLEVVGQQIEPKRAVLACRVVEPDQWCRRCGCEGTPRGTVVRRLAHEPFGWRPTILLVTVRRYRCGECGHVWRQEMSRAAEPRAKLSRRALRWARAGVEVVAVDGFTGFKTATTEEWPDATTVMDPFHVVRLAGDALDQCRRRIQQELHGHRGRAQDPLYRARRTLHTGSDLPIPRQQARLDALFTGDDHVQLEATYGVYQQLVAAYRDPDRANGRARMEALIASISSGVPSTLREVITLGRTLKKRATDVLAYFDRPGTSNGWPVNTVLWPASQGR